VRLFKPGPVTQGFLDLDLTQDLKP
jgi:hypothetical protein